MKCYGKEKQMAKYRKLEFIECDQCGDKITNGYNYYDVEIGFNEYGEVYEVCPQCLSNLMNDAMQNSFFKSLKIVSRRMTEHYEEIPEWQINEEVSVEDLTPLAELIRRKEK